MNLYLRLILVFISSRFKNPVSIFNEVVTRHLVLPNDLDPLGHMNNARFFSITDLVRIELLIRAGIWRALKKRHLIPLMAGETVQFLKPLMPFQRYFITTKAVGWDRKYFYVEHRFSSPKGLHALMLVKVRVIGRGSVRVSPSEVFNMVYPQQFDTVSTTPLIESWNDSSLNHKNQALAAG